MNLRGVREGTRVQYMKRNRRTTKSLAGGREKYYESYLKSKEETGFK